MESFILKWAKMWQMFRQVWPVVRVLNHNSSKTLEFRNAITNGVTIQIQFCTWVLGGCHQLQEEVPSATELGVRCLAGVSSWKGMRPKSRAGVALRARVAKLHIVARRQGGVWAHALPISNAPSRLSQAYPILPLKIPPWNVHKELLFTREIRFKIISTKIYQLEDVCILQFLGGCYNDAVKIGWTEVTLCAMCIFPGGCHCSEKRSNWHCVRLQRSFHLCVVATIL